MAKAILPLLVLLTAVLCGCSKPPAMTTKTAKAEPVFIMTARQRFTTRDRACKCWLLIRSNDTIV
jgi:hypothetical protein